MLLYKYVRLWFFFIAVSASSFAFAQGALVCGDLETGYGPYDYRLDKGKLHIVEKFHFTRDVEMLVRGASTLKIGADIAYTLHAFPNHHRALVSMMNLARKEKSSKPLGARYSVDCYFERAERFKPDDAMVKVIHGIYLTRTGRDSDAIKVLKSAERVNDRDANVNYNLGLALFALQDYEAALRSAHVAYAQGFPLPGLRNKLMRAGKWREK